MLARIGARELVEWLAFQELEAEEYERLRDEAEQGADTGPRLVAPHETMGGG